MRCRSWVLVGAVAAALPATVTDFASASRKFDLIESDRLPAGARITLTPPELNAYARQAVAQTAPQGVRNPHLELGFDTATATALVDFGKLRRAQGEEPGWLMSQILDGERPLRVVAGIHSAGGQATVDIQSVDISGVNIRGGVLDFLIRNYLMPMYPDARIGQPFLLGHRIDRLEVRPAAVAVQLRR